jgi:predicted RecB family endonuclease
MPAAKGSDYCYLHDPDPDVARRRRRNASRAATLGNSKIGTEIRSTRLLVRDIVELTVSGDLDALVRKHLTEIAQLLQVYARLAELEIAAGERPKVDDVALPEDTAEKVKEWAEGEAERERQREAFMGRLRAVDKDPRAALEAME